MRCMSQLRRKHTSLYAVVKLSIFKTMNACNGVVERPADDSRLITGNVWSSMSLVNKKLRVWLAFSNVDIVDENTNWLATSPTVQSPTDLSNLHINPLSKKCSTARHTPQIHAIKTPQVSLNSNRYIARRIIINSRQLTAKTHKIMQHRNTRVTRLKAPHYRYISIKHPTYG